MFSHTFFSLHTRKYIYIYICAYVCTIYFLILYSSGLSFNWFQYRFTDLSASQKKNDNSRTVQISNSSVVTWRRAENWVTVIEGEKWKTSEQVFFLEELHCIHVLPHRLNRMWLLAFCWIFLHLALCYGEEGSWTEMGQCAKMGGGCCWIRWKEKLISFISKLGFMQATFTTAYLMPVIFGHVFLLNDIWSTNIF